MGWVGRVAGLLSAVLLPLPGLAAPVPDLPDIRARGTLRVLVVGDEDDQGIQRDGTPAALDRDLAEDFARRQGLKLEIVWVERRHDILDDLLTGRGDVAATGLTITPERAARVTFTDPIVIVDELLIGRKGSKNPPRAPADLARRTVSIPTGSVFEASLAKLEVPGIRVEQVLGAVQQSELIGEVQRGERELAVVDSNVWDAERGWNPGAQALFPIARKRSIAWAVHPEAKQLKAALDLFIQQRALIAHADRTWSGDLADVKKHRVLRVLTRNNAVSYFLLRGEAAGFDHDLMKRFADGLDVRLQMVVPPSHADLVPWLLQGKGDVIAASYTVTPERGKRVAFSVPYLEIQELVVQRASEPLLRGVDDLRGRKIRIRPGSSYLATLERLRSRGAAFTIELARPDEETEQLIASVAAGEADLTVADSHIYQAERVWRSDVVAAFPLEPGAKQQLAFAVRPGDRELKALLDRFVRQSYKGLEYNMSWRRYFEDARIATEVRAQDAGTLQGLSSFDPLFRKYAQVYGFDWRLLAAQAYQESRFDPQAKSLAGALGLFQVLPRTAKELGFSRPEDPEEGAAAGIKHLARMADRLETTLPVQQRMRFALAAYNCGWGHLADARQLARAKSLDPDKWFKNVERAMLLLQQPAYYARARHGYVRGTEPVRYVSEIQTRYENYLKLVP
ncbi:MAG TPA: transporter substrate-binding domain-containing protein [Myxococcaceae bacterium]|nr:transporter substrate-binding domain-containing protein [Myxococcaceae bacterium]